MAAASITDTVQQAYLAYYGRPADPAGLAFWTAQVTSAGSMNAVINAFGTSAESTALYAGASTAAQVNAIYQQLFGRQADLTGLNFYVNAINNGTFTLASVALNIYNGAVGTDATQLTAKLAYADAFTAAVGQSVAAQLAYSSPAAAANARAAVATVVDTNSEATAQTALPTTLANIGTGTVAQTFALTNGVDSFTPTGNSVINGTIGGTSLTTPSTFTAGDKIVATGSNNTLNIVDVATAGGSALPGATTVSGVQTVNLTSGAATGAANFTGYTGLTVLNVVEAGGAAGITAAGTTAITLTDSATAATTINVQGGSNVSVTANAVTGGLTALTAGQINVGNVTAATGTVAVTENLSSTATGAVFADAITVQGGTAVTVTANLSEKAGLGNTVTGGAIGVTGTAATTTVTVNQTAAATAAAATAASAGSAGTTLATAAPGVQGVALTAAAPAVAASAAVAGVVDAAVTISDANASSTTVANTITSVSLANFGNGSAINDNALTSLSLTGGTGTLTLTNLATTPTNAALALSLNGVGSIASSGNVTAVTFTDVKNEITTLNVTTAGKDSYLAINDSKLATLNVSGTNALNLQNALSTTVKTIAVSGAAGFNDGGTLATDTGLTSFTTTSSGKIVATLNATQSFVGSSGQDVITISADATKAITGGSATNNEIIFNGLSSAFNATSAKLTNTNVTGFSVFGLGAAAAGTYDLSTLNAGFKTIDITAANFGANASDSIINAAKGTSLNIAGPSSLGVSVPGSTFGDTGTISVSYADTTGAADTVALSIGSGLSADLTIAGVTLQDANNVGIGTLNVTTSGSDIGNTGGSVDTITTLIDNGLSVLNVSGTAGLTITTLNEATTPATSFTINSTESGLNGTQIGTFTDANLGNLTFTGTAAADVQNLSLGTSTVTSLTIANSGTGTATVGDGGVGGLSFGTTLKSLTLTGNVALGVNAATAETATGATTGFTLSGASDNAHVNFSLSGAASGATDTITLGNGNDYVTDLSTQGKVNITVGTGSNLIDLHTGTGVGYSATVTLGAHTAADSILVGTVTAGVNAANTVITGAAKGDIITLADALFTTIAQATAPQQTTLGAAATFAAALTAADTGLASHTALAFQYGGNTYVLENGGATAGTGALAAGDTLVQLTGAHTVGVAAGHAFALTA